MAEPAGTLPLGRVVEVEVPATSANLGPGFDCLGLALDWRDVVEFEVTAADFIAEVTGEGAHRLPTGSTHLVLATALRALDELGLSAPGLRMRCHNTIPHGRGLGSSSAAIVSGLLGAAALAGRPDDHCWLLERASDLEGHPDNVAAAIHGGLVLAYESGAGVRATRGRLHPAIGTAVFVPSTPVSTRAARGLLPESVTHVDAAANAGRAALLVHALASEPDLLLEATRDWLHQRYRRPVMEESYELLTRLRGDGYPAVISGAGPTVIVLDRRERLTDLTQRDEPGFRLRLVEPGPGASARILVGDTPDQRATRM